MSIHDDTKIETVNTKFATSILNETIAQLTLLQCAELAEHLRDSEENTAKDKIKSKKFATDVNNIRTTFQQVINDLEKHHDFADFSGVSVAENESNFLTEYSMNKEKLTGLCSASRKLEDDIANHRVPIATVDVSFFFLIFN